MLEITKISDKRFNVGGAAMLIIIIKNHIKEMALEITNKPFVNNRLREKFL